MAAVSIDVVIRGARIVDGTGNPWRYGDVALSGDRVLEVAPPGSIAPERAHEVVDAPGKVVCPGFIDILSHSILPLMQDPRSLSKITQGVTTEIMGETWTPAPFGGRIDDPFAHSPSGLRMRERLRAWNQRARGWRRFGDWLEAMAEHGTSPNIGAFLGGGTLRQYAMGMEMGTANGEALATMRRVMAEALRDGALGVSYALIYPPDAYVSTDELIAVCEVVSEHGGLYITHMRSESDALLEAIDESITIGRRAHLPVEIYHLKASGPANWSKMPAAVRRITEARAEGVDVTADMYPYIASGTGLDAVLPQWAAAGGDLYTRLQDSALRARIREEVLHPAGGDGGLGARSDPESILPVGLERPEHQQYVGKRLSEIATQRGQHWLDTVFDLLAAEQQRVSTMYFLMSEENVALEMRQPWISFGTDAGGVDPAWARADGPTHPRAYGTFPRVLGKYVREEGVLPLEEAVRKMTSAVAARLGIGDRGLLRPGYLADVVLFDPASVADTATFAAPHQLSVGIGDVWVNGVRVLRDGEHTGATPGRIVRGPGYGGK